MSPLVSIPNQTKVRSAQTLAWSEGHKVGSVAQEALRPHHTGKPLGLQGGVSAYTQAACGSTDHLRCEEAALMWNDPGGCATIAARKAP